MDAIERLPKGAWTAGIDQNGDLLPDTFVADLTGLLDLGRWHDKIPDLRIIVRDEPLHPRVGQTAWLDARHRSHVHVENDVNRPKCWAWTGGPPDTGRSTSRGPRSSH